jgi:hypothetical protein
LKARSTKKVRTYLKDLNDNPYIDGVADFDGNIAIRPLTDSEFKWLEKFNSEFVEGNFNRDVDKNITEDNLHYDLIKQLEDMVIDLKLQIKELLVKLKETNGYRQMNDRKAYSKYKKNLYKQYDRLKESLKLVDITGEIFNRNWEKRNDVMAYVGQSQRTVRVTDHFSNSGIDTNEGKLFEYMESSKI